MSIRDLLVGSHITRLLVGLIVLCSWYASMHLLNNIYLPLQLFLVVYYLIAPMIALVLFSSSVFHTYQNRQEITLRNGGIVLVGNLIGALFSSIILYGYFFTTIVG